MAPRVHFTDATKLHRLGMILQTEVTIASSGSEIRIGLIIDIDDGEAIEADTIATLMGGDLHDVPLASGP